ncbi:helix-turn-helix domain-containing protein [Vagococcus lutrae]|nr:helix-turn-helix domain-containing protein [Vagococcus lutrae]
MEVSLSREQVNELKNYIYMITKESIAAAKEDAQLDRPFLKQRYMAEYLGISVNTLKKLECDGLPSIKLDGLKLYSKEDVKKWILSYQQ